MGLVNADVPELPPVERGDCGALFEEAIGQQQQVVEVHAAAGAHRCIVQLVNPPHGVVFNHLGDDKRVLEVADRLHPIIEARRLGLVVAGGDQHRAQFGVFSHGVAQDLLPVRVPFEDVGQAVDPDRLPAVRQHLHTEAVHRPDERPLRDLRDAGQTLRHLVGGLVRERQRQHPEVFPGPAEKPPHALRQDARFAGARTGHDEQGPVIVVYDFLLRSGQVDFS